MTERRFYWVEARMSNGVTRWKRDGEENRNQNEPDTGVEVPGDTDAPDIVGRTGEEMPEVAHDSVTDDDAAER
jgi:hypothetical protein